MTRKLFLAVLLLTLVALLTPGDWVLAAKQWVVSWLPFGRALDQADFTHGTDKWVHGSLFAALGALAVRGWRHHARLVWLLVALVGLGLGTEWLQQYIPYRGADLADVAADVAGLALGAGVAWWRARVAGHVRRGQGQACCTTPSTGQQHG